MSSSSSKTMETLTAEERARIERNRQRALLIRQTKQSKLSTNELYSLEAKQQTSSHSSYDSGGGFLIDDEEIDQRIINKNDAKNQSNDNNINEINDCIECKEQFEKSFLNRHFSVKICDNCKDLKEDHSLITRTDAKSEYLLKDCDLDSREPPLKFISKKNPHQFARGDMRLYLRFQVEERALEVWGTEELLEEERDKRLGKRHKRKQKQYENKIKNLRMSVRSSLYTKQSKAHSHEFGQEVYNEDNDMFEKVCQTCGHSVSYEKM
jgi:DNA-repair protein complementing XP-A cells